MESLTERQFEFLLKEYDLVQARVRAYETRSFQIKGWSVTIFSAALGIAIVQNKELLLVLPLLSSIIFWGLDALYNSFKRLMISRTLEIEKFVNGISDNLKPAHLGHAFELRDITFTGRVRRVAASLFVFSVIVLYAGKLFILSVMFLSM